ncbi:TetR/AcrR family transcriptional regulator [Actinospica sp.]|jgi:DNA-binding transcriptional regulator YbjK|uniref:TetR/AcrR family transcriptional regulator n=1 Tax=Actinospica sp. TaxID=1872142 RepID=UPI002C0853F3|nr:TetR/AcrR family transcriptional regulator [Actinospica sp.]HWG27037.1 TetR/AcrR family transcriptional regulator [Actinospica sp.]
MTDPRPPRSRPDIIGDTAIALLAERGLRGLTHRAVDEAAGLPPGSTSNHARTRSALLETAFARLVELEKAAMAPAVGREATVLPTGVDAIAAAVAQLLHQTLTQRRAQTLARFELALEATRRPELREIYDAAGAAFREPAVQLVTLLGAADPERQARAFIAWCEGVLFDSLAGAGSRRTPTAQELEHGLKELLNGMLTAGPDAERE